jgi:hypothetical protein
MVVSRITLTDPELNPAFWNKVFQISTDLNTDPSFYLNTVLLRIRIQGEQKIRIRADPVPYPHNDLPWHF